MLTSREKDSLMRLLFLLIGWPIGLDRFYEGDPTAGTATIFWWWFFFPAINFALFMAGRTGIGAAYVISPLLLLFCLVRLGRKIVLVARDFSTDETDY